MSEETFRHIYISDEGLHQELKGLLSAMPVKVFLEVDAPEDVQPEDILIISSLEQRNEKFNQTILISETVPAHQALHYGLIGVLHPRLLDHIIGQTYFSRLLGQNSSLALEVQFEDEGVGFRNFRLLNNRGQGHYSDLVSREIEKTSIHPVVPRLFLDSIMTYLFELGKKKRVSFPIEVDYGAFKDSFVVQIHCSMDNLKRENILESFGDYDPLSPMKGILSLVSKQVDVLDIYSLERSSRLVMTGVWFDHRFKKNSNLHPSVLLHHIEKFEASRLSEAHSKISLGASPMRSFEREAIKRIEGMSLEEMAKVVLGGGPSEEEARQWIGGVNIEDDEIHRVQGRFDEDDFFVRIKEGKEVTPEEKWKFKKAVMLEDLKEKFLIKGEQVDIDEVKQIVRNHLDLGEESLDELIRVESSNDIQTEQESEIWVDDRSDAQRIDHEILKRDAQIHKMKGLIDRMKAELQQKGGQLIGMEGDSSDYIEQLKQKNERLLKAKDKQIASLTKRNEMLVNDKLGSSLDESERVHFNNLKKEFENTKYQLEMANKRLAQLSENIEDKVKNHTVRLEREVESYKKQNLVAHEVIQKFKLEKAQVEEELQDSRSTEAKLRNDLNEVRKEQGGGEASAEENEKLKSKLEKEQQRAKALGDELKASQLALKKFEQKTKFLQAQIDSAQRAAAKAVGLRSGKGGEGAGDKRGQHFQKMIDSLKQTEEKLQSDLALKKDEANKLKSENQALTNKLADLERRLARYEKKAA